MSWEMLVFKSWLYVNKIRVYKRDINKYVYIIYIYINIVCIIYIYIYIYTKYILLNIYIYIYTYTQTKFWPINAHFVLLLVHKKSLIWLE